MQNEFLRVLPNLVRSARCRNRNLYREANKNVSLRNSGQPFYHFLLVWLSHSMLIKDFYGNFTGVTRNRELK